MGGALEGLEKILGVVWGGLTIRRLSRVVVIGLVFSRIEAFDGKKGT